MARQKSTTVLERMKDETPGGKHQAMAQVIVSVHEQPK